MTKKELLQLICDLNVSDDTEVVLPNMEYDGYERIKNVKRIELHEITQDGKKNCPETGCDFVDEREYSKRQENYEANSKIVIVLTH